MVLEHGCCLLNQLLPAGLSIKQVRLLLPYSECSALFDQRVQHRLDFSSGEVALSSGACYGVMSREGEPTSSDNTTA